MLQRQNKYKHGNFLSNCYCSISIKLISSNFVFVCRTMYLLLLAILVNVGVIATIPEYDYVGCYRDDIPRDLPHLALFGQNPMSADICAVHCDGYEYFGTEVTYFGSRIRAQMISLRMMAYYLKLVQNSQSLSCNSYVTATFRGKHAGCPI